MPEIKKISKADYEGLSTDQVKNYLKVDLSLTAEDDLINLLLKGAVDSVENYTNLAMRETELTVIFNDFDIDEGEVILPVYPVKSVTNVYLIGQNGEETESSFTNREGEVKASTWVEGDKIKVNYVAGYSSELPEPDDAKLYILQTIQNWYNDRDNFGIIPGTVRKGLKQISVRSWI